MALPGERVDGAEFIRTAIERGAGGVLYPAASSAVLPETVFRFPVPDNGSSAYRTLAHAWRRGFQIPIGAVAGAVGKTSTKEFLAALLTVLGGVVLKTQASENGFVGIPLTLLELRARHVAAAVEIGIDEPGAMAQHLEIVWPTAGLLTAIEEKNISKSSTSRARPN